MRVMLNLLGKVVAQHRTTKLPSILAPSAWLNEETVDVTGSLEELVAFSEELPYNFTAPMSDYFADIDVSPVVLHYPDKDGFSLNIAFRHLLDEDLVVDRVRVRLTLASDANQEIILQSDGSVSLQHGIVKLQVHSNITTYGHYLVDKLVLESRKLHFTQEFQPKPQTTPLGITNATMSERRPSMSGPSLLLYPHSDAFDAQVALASEIKIDQLRCIVVSVKSGRNDIKALNLRLKAASAGLRLHTADAQILDSAHEYLDTSQAGMLQLGAVTEGANIKVRVPYSTERSLNDLTVKLEANYQSTHGSSTYLRTSVVPVALPLDVDVNDIFKSQVLFSRFSIRTTNAVPLRIMNVSLQQSSTYSVKALPCPLPLTVFDKQPVSLVYRISRDGDRDTSQNKKEAALALSVEYLRMDEVVFDKLGATFEKALADTQFAILRRLLVPTLLNKAKAYAPAQKLEQAVLVGEYRMPPFEVFGWEKVVNSLPADKQSGLTQWLQDWCSVSSFHLYLFPVQGISNIIRTTPDSHWTTAT